MRTMHLIESERTGHATTGMHSFLSMSAHAAIVVAALYATTRPAVTHEPVPDPRVYFVPEQRQVVAAPKAPAAAPAPAPRKQPARTIELPTKAFVPGVPALTIPAPDVRLGDPSPVAIYPGAGGIADGAVPGAGDVARTGPYDAGEVEVAAAPLSKGGPAYPERAIRNGLSGAVTARFIVGADGRVERDVVILDSTAPEFSTAVRDFLRRGRYRAARVGGRAVRQLVEQRFVFELRR